MFPLTYVSTSASVTGSVEGISCHLEISGGQEKIRKIQTMEHAIVLERCRYVVFLFIYIYIYMRYSLGH